MADKPLGRREPTDWEHVERYPLTVTTTPTLPVPVTIGVNWYPAFDEPIQDRRGRWWVQEIPPLQEPRGGHCVCLEPGDPSTGGSFQDASGWHAFYDQGREGACVGFGSSRMMSLLNRKRYDARWLWNMAKEIDEWPDTNPGDDNGTSVRAAMDILRRQGHKPMTPSAKVKPEEGIAANRWATRVEQISDALQSPANERLGAVRFLNSWGKAVPNWTPDKPGYPHRVWMPMETLQRLLDEDGEATIVTDR